MGLIERARKSAQRIVSNLNGFGQEIILRSPSGVVLKINGLHKKIRLGIDTEGNIINSKTATITISDLDLTMAGYPFRDNNKEVDLTAHHVSVADVTGLQCSYMIQSWHPDETIGIIVCYLQDFE